MVAAARFHGPRWGSLAALVALLCVMLPVGAQAANGASPTVTSRTTVTTVDGATTRSYVLRDTTGDEHSFSVTFDSKGGVLSTTGGGSEEVLLGSTSSRQAALAALAALHDQGILKLVVNADEPATTNAEGWAVINQTASPTAWSLPDSSTYDAVLSAPDSGGRTLLFFSDGQLVEARTYAAAASGLLQVKVTIEIDCEITWDSENGFKLRCTIRIKVGPLTVFEHEFVFP